MTNCRIDDLEKQNTGDFALKSDLDSINLDIAKKVDIKNIDTMMTLLNEMGEKIK